MCNTVTGMFIFSNQAKQLAGNSVNATCTWWFNAVTWYTKYFSTNQMLFSIMY